jgi:hypothetical protein
MLLVDTDVSLDESVSHSHTAERVCDRSAFGMLQAALRETCDLQLLLLGVGAKIRLRCDDAMLSDRRLHAGWTIEALNGDARALFGDRLVGLPAVDVLQCKRVTSATALDLPSCIVSLNAQCTQLRGNTVCGWRRLHIAALIELSPSPFDEKMHVRALTMTVLQVAEDF